MALALSLGAKLSSSWRLKDLAIRALVPFIEVVDDRVKQGDSLAAAACIAAARYPAAADHFILDGNGLRLHERWLFPADDELEELVFIAEEQLLRLRLEGHAADFAECLRLCASGEYSESQLKDRLPDAMHELVDELVAIGFLTHARPRASFGWGSADHGIVRLQHASLLYRTPRSGVLVDPHFNSSYEPLGLGSNFRLCDVVGEVGAIAISHSHTDHFHLPTLMMFPRTTPIIVPRVHSPSLLCEDMAATLRGLGFTNVIDLDWYDPPVHIGDFEVHVFPFYGEQPLATERPRDARLRNWGNTYVVRSDRMTSWFVIDSGSDPAGSMADVARSIRRRFGSIDVLLSNLRTFTPFTPLYITGGGHYWLSLAPQQMQRFAAHQWETLTLAPRGVAELCAITKARRFLPYAHWWGEIGAEPSDDEMVLVDELERELATYGAPTQVTRWRIGETFRIS